MILLCSLLAPLIGLGHPMHSEAIKRTSELRLPGGKDSIQGLCSFHVAGGYLIFEFSPSVPETAPGGNFYSGVINLYHSTGSLFQTVGGPLGEGTVALAEASSEVVHLDSDVLASWDNGCAILVSGDPIGKDRQCAGCGTLFTKQAYDAHLKKAAHLKKLKRIRPPSAQTSPSESHDDQHPLESPILSSNRNHENQEP